MHIISVLFNHLLERRPKKNRRGRFSEREFRGVMKEKRKRTVVGLALRARSRSALDHARSLRVSSLKYGK